MNSSTSTSDPAAWRRVLWAYPVACLLFALLAVAVIVGLDPYDTGRFALFGDYGVPGFGQRLTGASEARARDTEAAVLGNSTMQLLDPERLTELTGWRFVSLTMTYTGPTEQLAIARWLVRHHDGIRGPALKGLVLGIDTTWCQSDGIFNFDTSTRLQTITDGTSNTIVVGEFARFKNDPDPPFNTWTVATLWGSALDMNTTRPQGLASSVARINAPFAVDNILSYPSTNWTFPTGDVDSWCFIQNNGADYRLLGQFGFRSQHPGGANFLFADGSVKFLKETIDMGNPNYTPPISKGVYRQLSTRNGGEVISSDAY